MIKQIIIAGSFFLLLFIVSCGQSDSTIVENNDTSDNLITVQADSMDTSYAIRYDRLYVEIHKRGKLFSKRAYDLSSDSVFNSGRTIKFTHQEYMRGQPELYREYYPNGQIRYESYTSDYDGMGGTTGEHKYYDPLGNLDSAFSNKDYLPENATGHLDICGVVNASYYLNGKLTRIIHHDVQYEAGMQCPCGTWEYYDTTGKLMRTEKFKKCGNGKTDCEEAF